MTPTSNVTNPGKPAHCNEVVRKTKNGWVANFPGSDRLVMTRKSQH